MIDDVIGKISEHCRFLFEPSPWFGLQAPWLQWYVALLLIGLFVVSILMLLAQAIPFRFRLAKARKRILAIGPTTQPLDGMGVEELGRILSASSVLREQWDEFQETLIRETQPNGTTRIYNTEQADAFFGEDRTIDRIIFARFYAAVPGLLTGIGLLFTFVAILIALNHVTDTVGTKVVIKENGVENLIGGLSGKFITSIAALFCSTLFVFIERLVLGGLRLRHHDFIGAINQRLARRSAELVLQEIHRNIAEQTVAFKRFDTDLSNSVKNSVKDGLLPLTERIASALDALSKERQESSTEAIRSLVEDFRSVVPQWKPEFA